MEERYKVVLSSKKIYKEIEISPENDELHIGTSPECDVRLRKGLFFAPFELTLKKVDGRWTVFCSDNLYLTPGDVRKLLTKQLHHGDELSVKYQESDNTLFSISFMIDFDYAEKDYGVEIDLAGKTQIKVGGSGDCDILFYSEYLGTDSFTLNLKNDMAMVVDNRSQYGVFVNGMRINGKKEIHSSDFISIVGFSFYYKGGHLYTSHNDSMRINGLSYRDCETSSTHFKYPKFIRNSRVQYCIPEDEIEIKQPMPKPQKTKKNLILSLIPSLLMLVLMVVLRGIMGGGGMFVIYSVCSMSIGILMSIVTYRVDGKEYVKEVEKREQDYRGYIAEKEQQIVESRNNELRIRNLIYESLQSSIYEVKTYGKRLFERSGADKDFLDIYLGKGSVESSVPVKYTKEDFIDTEDPIANLPAEVEEKYRNIENAPIVARFNSDCGVGVVGPKETLHAVLRNLTLDLVIRHFYKEVKVYYMFNEDDADTVGWTRWLRHVYNDEIGIRNIMCDDESRKILLENLYAVLSERESMKKESETVQFDTYYVVFVLDSANIRNHPVSKYIEKCNDFGFTFVFFEEYEEFLPKGCTEIIRLDDRKNEGTLLASENGDIQTRFSYQIVSAEQAEEVALKLGAISVDEVSLEKELTRNITLFQLLDIFTTDDLDLKKRWASSQVYRSMAAPLGVKTKNEVVYLDIGDKASAHGPHGLVAGTTGSGKSEILQTYVLSMATLFHPYDVGFVIIDFKGGGMANQFKDLPHMMGAITNIDGREINRSLLSIKAELVKRQSLFAQAGVNHINDYIKLFKSGAVQQPLPHMIIIVDEFAELKAEYPDFMKELISAARIGRTLGVHLILATQKPAGVVDAQIWSNSKFKLCLKVQTKEDSSEVIKTPLAAEIVEPGRAYFQVGNNEIFELFQSAYSGAKVVDASESKAMTYSVYELNSWGKRKEVYTNKRENQNDSSQNQLQAIVDYVNEYCRESGIERLGGICLPPLADVVTRSGLKEFAVTGQEIVVPVGVFDDPERQEQGNYCLNLSDNNTYVIGSAMTGKTTLLQTILLQLIKYYTPREVNVYIVDCGNMTMKVFEDSNLVGGVALTAEEEKVHNLFKMLFRIIDERKKAFSEKGLGTHSAYVEAGYTDMPQIVVMIDNLAAFREYYDDLSDDFLALSREGNSVGISFVATANQTNAMNYKAMSNYGTRIALVCNDSGEYMNLFDRCRIEPKDTAGRGLCVIDKRILEFQTVLCVAGDKEIERVENIKKLIATCNEQFSGAMANEIPTVPDVIWFSSIKNRHDLYKATYKIPVGIGYSSVQYYMLELDKIGLLVTFGREKSGKTNFVRHLFAAIQCNVFNSLTEAYVIDNADRTLGFTREYGFVEKYTTDLAELEMVVDRIEMQLQERQNAMSEDPDYSLAEQPMLLLVVENPQFFTALQSNKELSGRLTQMVKQYKKYKFAILLSAIENTSVPFSAPDFMKFAKENKRFVVFDELSEVKFFDVSMRQTKDNAKPLAKGDAFVCIGSEIERVKTIYMGDE